MSLKDNIDSLKSSSIDKEVEKQYINVSEVEGLTLEEILKKFKPIQRDEFYLNVGPMTEFRVELYNFFSEQERLNPILIKELTWRTSELANYTIWFVKNDNDWVPIDSCLWGKNREF